MTEDLHGKQKLVHLNQNIKSIPNNNWTIEQIFQLKPS